jgi:hypothetical protein
MSSRTLVVRATGVIDPGPAARRTRTSFFQDGDYQTEVFRQLEAKDPSIEHLGNWHTHHVNGYPTLSTGDLATYRRIVNHELHNTDFFYALLVTHKNEGRSGLDRYAVRHYVFFRGDSAVHEVASANVRLTHNTGPWPPDAAAVGQSSDKEDVQGRGSHSRLGVRAQDHSVLRILCPSLQPRLTAQSSTFLWKGPLTLIDGSVLEIKVVEVNGEDGVHYYPILPQVSENVGQLCERAFHSAGEAVRAVELWMNQRLYESATKGGGG